MQKNLLKMNANAVNRAVDAVKINFNHQLIFMQEQLTTTLSLTIALSEEERQEAISLLEQHNLPVQDLDDEKLLYILKKDDKAIGTVGLEIYDDCALLRSVSIQKEEQGNGYGRYLNDAIETYAKESGITCMYLLTTTARRFFDKQGYCRISREETPEIIKQTAEFTSLCPSSAVVMKKRL